MKTQMSRFQIHDDLTAPEGSLPVLKGAMASGGQLPNFLGVLAGSPAALRAYARFRSELRHGSLARPTLERIALAVAEHYRSQPGLAIHTRTARQAGVGIDEVAAARDWESADPREAALLRYLRALLEQRGHAPMHLHEEAREAGWSDEQLLEAIAYVSLESLTAMVNVAGEVPGRRLRRGHARPAGGVGFSAMSPSAPQAHGRRDAGPARRGALLPDPARGGRADRQALVGRDHRRPARGRRDALLRDRAGDPAALRPAALRADEGARGARDRRAPRARRSRRRASSTR